jgi:hypothetical protein
MNTMTPSVMLDNTSLSSLIQNSGSNNLTSNTNNMSLFPTKSRFATTTMNNPTLTGNKTNPNLLPINNPVLPTETMSQKRMASNFGYSPSSTAVEDNTTSSGLSMGDKAQLAGLVPATIYNTIQALRPAEKFSPLNSPLFGAGLNDMNQNVRFNTNPILMNRNVGANQINQGSTSDAVRRANLQSLYRGTNTQLGEMAEKEALTNAQIKQQLGQAKIGVGAQDVAAQERARQYNVQARQAKQQFGATAASQFGQGLTEFGKSSNQGLSNQMGYNTLQNLFSNYKLSGESYSDFLKRLDAGKVQFKK